MTDRPIEQRTLHFALPFLDDECEPRLHVGLARHALLRHDEQTLAASRGANRAIALLDDTQVTHYVEDVPLPADQAQLLLVTAPSRVDGAKLPTILLTKIHVPRAARIAEAARRAASGPQPTHPALAFAGVTDDGGDPDIPVHVDDWVSAMDAAVQCIFMHGEMVNIGKDTAATVTQTITYANGISDLAEAIYEQALAHGKDPRKVNWVYETPYSLPDGTPSSTPRWTWSAKTMEWMPGPMQSALKTVKNTPHLESTATSAGCYTVQSGITAVASSQGRSAHAVTGPHVLVTAPAAGGGRSWTVDDLTPQHGFTYNDDVAVVDGTFTASFTNSWLRWLTGYVEFLGPDGKVVAPEGWTSQALVPGVETDTKKYVALFSSVNTMLAIPVGSTPTTISFLWPANAAGVRIWAGGIGRTGGIAGQGGVYYGGWDGTVCAGGATMTGIFNFGIPVVMLAMGAGVSQSQLSDLAKAVTGTALDVATALINGPLAAGISGGGTTMLLTAFADALPHLLLDTPDLVAALVAEGIAEAAIEEATPIFGWIALALSILTTVAALAETTAEVALSPARFEVVATAAIDAEWTLHGATSHQGIWPLDATHYVITAMFTDGTTRVTTGDMGKAPQTGPIVVGFDAANHNQLPAGGTVQFTAAFYSDTNWLCATATSEPMSAALETTLLVPEQAVTETVVPLTASTQYEYVNSLGYDAATSKHVWDTIRPQATITSLDPSNQTAAIGALGQITVNQPQSQVGYDWQASGQGIPVYGDSAPTAAQMYVAQTISVQPDPAAGLRFSPAGFVANCPVAYGLQEPAVGDNFYLDPSAGQYHLRQIVLDGSSGTLTYPKDASFGRFNQAIGSLLVHPSGLAVGVSTETAKLEVLSLAAAATTDVAAPLADMYCGYGARAGLLHEPVGVAAAAGSGVIVLENADGDLVGGEARMQALDLRGNPAPIFAGGASTAPLRHEAGPVTALAIATEAKGFIYVLKFLGDGGQMADYLLDLYAPDGSLLSQTVGLPAGSIAVDLWRTLYTLDYQQIAKPSGARPEPSVSQWRPTTP